MEERPSEKRKNWSLGIKTGCSFSLSQSDWQGSHIIFLIINCDIKHSKVATETWYTNYFTSVPLMCYYCFCHSWYCCYQESPGQPQHHEAPVKQEMDQKELEQTSEVGDAFWVLLPQSFSFRKFDSKQSASLATWCCYHASCRSNKDHRSNPSKQEGFQLTTKVGCFSVTAPMNCYTAIDNCWHQLWYAVHIISAGTTTRSICKEAAEKRYIEVLIEMTVLVQVLWCL